MQRHSRQHSEATQIVEQILKEADEPRQATSGKETLDRKKTPVSVPPQTSGGNRGGKTRAAPKKLDLPIIWLKPGNCLATELGPEMLDVLPAGLATQDTLFPVPLTPIAQGVHRLVRVEKNLNRLGMIQ